MPRRALVPQQLTYGAFTLDEARRAGLTRRQLQGTKWRRIGPSTYRLADLGDSTHSRIAAALRSLPNGSVVAGRTAAWIHGTALGVDDEIEVNVPSESGISTRAGVRVRRVELARADVVTVDGLPVTSPSRTIADLARTDDLVTAVVACDSFLNRRLMTVKELAKAQARASTGPGSARLRRVVDLAEPKAQSPGETHLRLIIVLAGLPRPIAQFEIRDFWHRFLARPDLAYPGARLALEYDGGIHSQQLQDDLRRQDRILNAGWRVLRFTKADVFGDPEGVVASVRHALSVPLATNARLKSA